MNTGRIQEIHLGTAYPESTSVAQALLQVWNECAQERIPRVEAMQRIIVLLLKDAETIPHEVVSLGIEHDIEFDETPIPDCWDTGYKGAVPETCAKCGHAEDCDEG